MVRGRHRGRGSGAMGSRVQGGRRAAAGAARVDGAPGRRTAESRPRAGCRGDDGRCAQRGSPRPPLGRQCKTDPGAHHLHSRARCRLARRLGRGAERNAGGVAGATIRRGHPAGRPGPRGPRRGAARSAHLGAAGGPGPAGPHPSDGAERLPNAGGLRQPDGSGPRGATPGDVRAHRDAAGGRGAGAPDAPSALAGGQTGAGDARPRGILANHVLRSAEGPAGAISQALLARRPPRGEADRSGACGRSEGELGAGGGCSDSIGDATNSALRTSRP